MPVHYREVHDQIVTASIQARNRQERLIANRQSAFDLMTQKSNNLSELSDLVETVRQVNQHLRCAVPLREELTAHLQVSQAISNYVVLAADGSQINPDRHAQVAFGLVNVGAFRMEIGGNQTPRQYIRSELIIPDPFDPEDWQLNEQTVALKRDLSERTILAELAPTETLPTIALTDGPLEMFHDPQESKYFKDRFNEYIESLYQMALCKGITAGYVVKPGSDQTVRMLELTLLSPEDYPRASRPVKLAGVIDADLFSRILAPGERSAVFKLQSTSSSIYQSFHKELELCFFYINPGMSNPPTLARVEIPAWVADRPEFVDILHAALIEQCKILGNKPYPYALHRSHELALVRQEEKDQVLEMILRELNRQKVVPGEKSTKQAVKDTSRKHRG